jgi:hypothetical protein
MRKREKGEKRGKGNGMGKAGRRFETGIFEISKKKREGEERGKNTKSLNDCGG